VKRLRKTYQRKSATCSHSSSGWRENGGTRHRFANKPGSSSRTTKEARPTGRLPPIVTDECQGRSNPTLSLFQGRGCGLSGPRIMKIGPQEAEMRSAELETVCHAGHETPHRQQGAFSAGKGSSMLAAMSGRFSNSTGTPWSSSFARYATSTFIAVLLAPLRCPVFECEYTLSLLATATASLVFGVSMTVT